MIYKKVILILSLLTNQNYLICKKAFVAVPITDLVGNQLKTGKKKPYQTYKTLPLESIKGSSYCKRIHQLLFNETVEIIEETKKEVKVKISNAFYVDKNGNPQTTYWARKKDFVTFDQLKKCNLDKSCIPKPISYNVKNFQEHNKDVITLTFPFFDKKTNNTFSAGTRIVKAKKQNKKKHFNVFVFDKKNFIFKKTLIPKKLCCDNSQKNNLQKRQDFLHLLKKWTHLQQGFIPYVWGGCSFTHLCNHNKIVQIKCKSNSPNPATIYMRKNFNHTPIPGFDCSGLVCRAAQICNIPYFYKNTTTIGKFLDEVHNIKQLKNGDLIVYSGHVMIVSDIKNNKIIEARTNEYGCGKVQEVSLQNAFKDIATYVDIFEHQKQNKTLYRINKNRNAVQAIKNIKFRKLI